ncbi:hypothetical protein Q7P37_008475 [Cladosporium fusiforme]
MRFLQACQIGGAGLLALCQAVAAAPNPHTLEPRQRVSDSACKNGPFTRACWQAGYSIATDFDNKTPPDGRERVYDLEITNTTMAPDGYERLVMAVNGQYPGPTLEANWGDTMVVNVKNSLQHNGTSIHWHGVRMLNSCHHDGVNGVTECPVPPGGTTQYRFRCTQHGTTWYHSHFSAQYGDGVVGALVVHGPASSNYDHDLGPITFTDWFHETAFVNNHKALHSQRGPPVPETGLINGTMKGEHGGKYHVTTLKKGKKHRLRLINTGIDNNFHISIDGHNFTVITSDFVPIKPYVTNSVSINIGQRYDIIIHANQAVGNYWLRADVASECAPNQNPNKIKSIVRYEGAPIEEPTTQNATAPLTGCYDESVTPYAPNQVPQDKFQDAIKHFNLDYDGSLADGPSVKWLINDTDIEVNWSKPTLEFVQDGNYTFERKMNVFEIKEKDAWTFWLVQTVDGAPPLAHPMHLHGHDFYVIGQGSGTWDGSTAGLQFDNPPRRDTALIPAGGYLIMGFPADNPGTWLVHCHIPWHVGQGLSWQFLERKEEILETIGDLSNFNSNCDSWREWWDVPKNPNRPYDMDDSGL